MKLLNKVRFEKIPAIGGYVRLLKSFKCRIIDSISMYKYVLFLY